jgi:O-antigen/teichoic acid export membrane protein
MLKNVKHLIKNAFIYGLGNTSAKIVGFILLPIYTKHLTVSDYGILGIIEITTQIIISIFGLSLYRAFLRWYWDKECRDKQRKIFFTTIIFTLFMSLITFIFFSIISDQLSSVLFDSIKYSFLIKLMAASAAFQILLQLISTLMRIQEKSILYSVTNIIRFTLTLFITIYFVAYLDMKVEGIYISQIIGHLFYLILVIKYVLINIEIKLEPDILKEMLLYSLPLVFSSIGGLILTIADKYSLKFLIGLSAVGIYALGFKIANSIKVFIIKSVQLALAPMNYKMMDQPENKRFYSKVLTYFTFGVMFFVIGFSIFSYEIITLLARDQAYWDAYKIVPLLSFAILFDMLRYTSTIGLNITKKTKDIAVIFTLIAILNLALNFALIPQLSYIGAALATLLTNILFFFIILNRAQKYFFIPYEYTKIAKMIFGGTTIVVLSYLTNGMNLPTRLLFKLAMLILFPIILYFLNFYEEIELLRIKQSWIKWRDPRKWKMYIQK